MALLLINNFHKTCFDVICFRHTNVEEEGFGREEKRVFLLQAVQATKTEYVGVVTVTGVVPVTGGVPATVNFFYF